MTLPLIVWDVDDVLNNLTFEWFEEFKADACSGLAYGQLSENPPDKILGISMDAYLKSLDDFRRRKMSSLEPVPEILDWFRLNGAKFRHAALTAVPFSFAAFSAQWVIGNFGNWIRTYHFVPSFRKHDKIVSYDRKKSDILKRIGDVEYFVDDNEFNVHDAESLGIKSIVFPRPWNKNKDLPVSEILRKLGDWNSNR